MDVKSKPQKKSHAEILTKSLISKLSFSFFTYPAAFILSFTLSRAVFLGSAAPLGLAACGALGAGRFSALGLLGAILGYVSVFEKVNSLKYIASIILIFTAHFVFSGTSLPKKRLFTPLSVIIPTLCINFVFLAEGGFTLFDTALSAFEILLSSISAVLLSPLTVSERAHPRATLAGLFTLAFGVCAALSAFTVLGIFSPGRALALLLISLCALVGGVGSGAASGLILGCAISLSRIKAEYAIIFGVCGILVSTFSRFGKIVSLLISFALSVCICACLDTGLVPSFLIEFFLAAVLTFLFENTFTKYTHRLFAKVSPRNDLHLRRYATERLTAAAKAFRSLGNYLSEFREKKSAQTLADVRSLFEKSTGATCKKCSLRTICWDRDFQSTRDAFTKAGNAITTNGVLSARDFPVYFSSRCLNTENFVNSANREIFAMRYRSKFDEVLHESRKLLRKQYSDIASVFDGLSLDISNNARFDDISEIEIRDELTRRGILCDAAVYRDSENHMNIHICGRDLSSVMEKSEEFLTLFSKICGVNFASPKFSPTQELDDIIIRELPQFRAEFGVATQSRSACEKNGDSGSLFYPANGRLALLLSDGMGSGNLAAKESATTVNLLSELLRAGLSPKDALSTLQSTLTLRTEFTRSFATLDLLTINLFTGASEIYKLGGAPTYIKRKDTVHRVTSSSLPAGITIAKKCDPEITPFTLREGDFVIMTSDGIADGCDDVQLLEFLSGLSPASPKALADELLAFSLSHYKKNDDMTVAVIRIVSAY